MSDSNDAVMNFKEFLKNTVGIKTPLFDNSVSDLMDNNEEEIITYLSEQPENMRKTDFSDELANLESDWS